MLALNHTVNVWIFPNGMHRQRIEISDRQWSQVWAGVLLFLSLLALIGGLIEIGRNAGEFLDFAGKILAIRVISLAWGFFG